MADSSKVLVNQRGLSVLLFSEESSHTYWNTLMALYSVSTQFLWLTRGFYHCGLHCSLPVHAVNSLQMLEEASR